MAAARCPPAFSSRRSEGSKGLCSVGPFCFFRRQTTIEGGNRVEGEKQDATPNSKQCL